MRAARRLALLIVLFLGVAAAQRTLDAERTDRLKQTPKLLYMPQSDVMQILSFGHRSALADILYILTINYVMAELEKGPNPAYLDRLFNTITNLDPQYIDAYSYGFLFLVNVAQRHQAGLDLLAHADGERFEVGAGGKVQDASSPARAAPPPSILDFKARWLARPEQRGAVHELHRDRWKINQTRGAYFLVFHRDTIRAGHEFLRVAVGLGSPLGDPWRKLGEKFVTEGASYQEETQLQIARAELENQIQRGRNENLIARARERSEEIDTRMVELDLERRVARLARMRDIRARSFAEFEQHVTLTPKPLDPFKTGYVIFPDGRVRSPGRVEREALRSILERLRDYSDRHAGALPPSLAAMGLTAADLPPDVDVSYDPTSGRSVVKFKGPS